MSLATFEGVVEQGQIRLTTNARLPEGAKVYVVLPDVMIEQFARIISPRLARPEQVSDFAMEIGEEPTDASI
jgi:hypothetical protein